MNRDCLTVSATGRPLTKVGDIAWRQFSRGDYSVSIEWYSEGRSCEPIMAIWSKRAGHNAGVFGICLSSIGKYADASGSPTAESFLECLRALPMLGRNQTDSEVYALLDVILRHTPDLLCCPPMPDAWRLAEAPEALLDVRIVDEDGKTRSGAII